MIAHRNEYCGTLKFYEWVPGMQNVLALWLLLLQWPHTHTHTRINRRKWRDGKRRQRKAENIKPNIFVAAQGSGQKRTFHNLLHFMVERWRQWQATSEPTEQQSQLKIQMNTKLWQMPRAVLPQSLFCHPVPLWGYPPSIALPTPSGLVGGNSCFLYTDNFWPDLSRPPPMPPKMLRNYYYILCQFNEFSMCIVCACRWTLARVGREWVGLKIGVT